MPSYRIGIDIGGTFTDFVLLDVDSGVTKTFKTPTTPREPGAAVLEGWRHLLTDGSERDAVEMAVHGTTLITNATSLRSGPFSLIARSTLTPLKSFASAQVQPRPAEMGSVSGEMSFPWSG